MARKSIPTKTDLLNYDMANRSIKKVPQVTNITDRVAIIYCRVSDKQQVSEGHGLESQELYCRQWCENQTPPIRIERVFKEPGVSGAETSRKELSIALEYLQIENKKFKRITNFVVSEASRISRPENIAEAFMLEEEIKSFGVEIVKVDSPGIDETTDEGLLFKTIQYAIAGYERRKIAQRTNNGRKNRLMMGYRPFNNPPLGYIRKRFPNKEYKDEVEEKTAYLIAEGLEMYSKDLLNKQMDLWNYRNDRGLRTHALGAHKLQRTFVEKALQLHRLFYYAGHIIYPRRGVNVPVKGQHKGIISLEIAERIVKKIQREQKGKKAIRNFTYKMSDEHPLRGVITCTGCGRKFTSWNTAKYSGKGESRKKTLYPYYGCTKVGCPQRVTIPKKRLEMEFENLLNDMALPKPILMLIEHQFAEARKKYKENKASRNKITKQKIQSLKRKQTRIEGLLLKSKPILLHNKYEEQRVNLQSEIEVHEELLTNEKSSHKDMRDTLIKSKLLFENPASLRVMGNQSMRKLLLAVRFGENLYYHNDSRDRTAESGSFYSIFSVFKCNNNFDQDHREGDQTNITKFIEFFEAFTITNSAKIDGFYKFMMEEGLIVNRQNKGRIFLRPKKE